MKKVLQVLLIPLIMFSCTKETKTPQKQKRLHDVVLENRQKDETARRAAKPPQNGPVPAVILLDLDGHTVSGTLWNTNGTFVCAPTGYNVPKVKKILDSVRAHFSLFSDSLEITTDESRYWSAPYNKRIRAVATPSWEWYQQQVAGVAYLNSFTWGGLEPCFVFTSLLNDDLAVIAYTITHEVGHTIGLRHKSLWVTNPDSSCYKADEYHPGDGIKTNYMSLVYPPASGEWDVSANSLCCTCFVDQVAFIKSKL